MIQKNEMYFRNIDSEICEELQDLLDEAKHEGLDKITLVEAIPDNGNPDTIWCSLEGTCSERSECKKAICNGYTSKSGRGKCDYRGNLYLHGNEKTFIIED